MLSKFSIRTKITFVVSALLISLLGVGAFSVQKLRTLNAAAEQLEKVWLPSVQMLGDLRAETAQYRDIMRAHLAAETRAAKSALEDQIDELNARMDLSRIRYERMIVSAEERKLYSDWVQQWNAYAESSQEVIAASRSADGNMSAARALNDQKVVPLGERADQTLITAVGLNREGAKAAGAVASAEYSVASSTLMISIAIAFAVGICLSVLLIRDVSSGIASIVKAMQLLSGGNLSTTIPHRGLATEVGSMGNALQLFKQALIEKRAADETASRDADDKIHRSERVNAITSDFEMVIGQIVEQVANASMELEASAGTLTATAVRSQQLASVVSNASGEASNNVQSVASAAEELTSSVSEISRQVQQSAQIASEAVVQARQTNDRVGELSRAAARIGDVVELINTIAGQTNLLALNATIEAARAGDAGRGFAVVASEVKALAEQTSKATGEISQQISGIQSATQESVGAIKAIGDTIDRISEISSTIASAVEQQGAATQEISRNVQQASQGTMEVTSNIADVESGANETGSASSQVLSAAQFLAVESSRLKQEVSRFLHDVRAA